MKGRILWETVGSVVLKGNPLGDPRLREFPVYVPPGYETQTRRRYPLIYFLTGFTGTAKGLVWTHPWKEGVFQRLDRLIASGKIPPMLMAAPDCFTAYGGSQYRNSEATGRYEDHILQELAGYIDAKYRTAAGPSARAVMGKSSGGYGALWLGMRHPDVFGHVACHSGDMLFEVCYRGDFPKCVNALSKFGGSFAAFLREFSKSREKMSFPHELINAAGMAAAYSPNKKNPMGLDIPFDERTAEILPPVWARWLACDPVRLAGDYAGNLRKLKTLYFDCGARDEFYLHLGARKLSGVLKSLRVKHVYEEHGLGHFDMSERYDVSLKRLAAAMGVDAQA